MLQTIHLTATKVDSGLKRFVYVTYKKAYLFMCSSKLKDILFWNLLTIDIIFTLLPIFRFLFYEFYIIGFSGSAII